MKTSSLAGYLRFWAKMSLSKMMLCYAYHQDLRVSPDLFLELA